MPRYVHGAMKKFEEEKNFPIMIFVWFIADEKVEGVGEGNEDG